MAFAFSEVHGEAAVDLEMMLEDDGPNGNWTWLQSSRSHPTRLEPGEWPDGLAKSVDHRNTARGGQEKGRVLIVSSGPHGKPELSPVCAHVLARTGGHLAAVGPKSRLPTRPRC